jgi:hypothetical protein
MYRMIQKQIAPWVFMLLMVISAAAAYSQERETVPIAELQRIHELTTTIAEEVAAKRQKLDSDEAAQAFLRYVAEAQRLFEPVIVSIAETNAPKEAQLYAISVAIAVKEVELALWHYINAFVSNQQKYLNSADAFLLEGQSELTRAGLLAP